MQTVAQSIPGSKAKIRTAGVLSGIAVLFMLFDSTIHLMAIPPVVEAFNQLGFSINLAVPIAVIELVCVILYLIPQTSVFGAVLLTGYLGGAVAANLRIGTPLLSNVLFPVYIGILAWAGLYLRDARLRELFPVRKS